MNRLRQRLVLLSALSMIAVLCCACGTAKRWPLPEQTEREARTAATVSEEPQTTVCSENTTAWTTLAETTTEAMEEIPFYPYSCSITDSNGYRIEQVLSVSPWISQNDSSALNAAWSRVSRGKPFPSLGEMGISNNYVISGFGKNYIEFDEVLFAVGTIDMYNRTEGFPIASSNPYSAAFYLYGANRFNTLTVLYGNGSRTYYFVAGGVFGTQGGGWSPITAKMQSDHWGPVSFVLAQAIDKTPNNPSGNPACTDVVFRFGDESFSLPQWKPE